MPTAILRVGKPLGRPFNVRSMLWPLDRMTLTNPTTPAVAGGMTSTWVPQMDRPLAGTWWRFSTPPPPGRRSHPLLNPSSQITRSSTVSKAPVSSIIRRDKIRCQTPPGQASRCRRSSLPATIRFPERARHSSAIGGKAKRLVGITQARVGIAKIGAALMQCSTSSRDSNCRASRHYPV